MIFELYSLFNIIFCPPNLRLEEFVTNNFNSFHGKLRFYKFNKTVSNTPIPYFYIFFRQSIYLTDFGYMTVIGVHDFTIDHYNHFYGKFEFLKFVNAVNNGDLADYRQSEINTMREFYRPPRELELSWRRMERRNMLYRLRLIEIE